MKNLVLLFTAILFSTTGVFAKSTTEDKVALRNAYRTNNSFIFIENGVTFSVYPDGEFDFYIDNRLNIGANVNIGRTNVTFNSGFDYSPFAQYDDYGAVIQVENVPIYYDFYGRVNQIGDINVNYRSGRVNRLGGMNVFYNNRGLFDRHTGYINAYNRNYVYRPFHNYFARPSVGLCLVYSRPYRRYYQPVRYTFHRPYRLNNRRSYAQVGRNYKYNKTRRSTIYRNDNRVVARANNRTNRSSNTVRNTNNNRVANNRSVATRKSSNTRTTNIARRANANSNNRTANRNSTTRTTNRNVVNRGSNDRAVAQRSTRAVRTNNANRTVTNRSVTRTPQSKTVTRTTKTYKKPQSSNNNRSTVSRKTSTQRSSAARSTSRNTRSSGNVSRSSSSKKTTSRAPSSRSSKNNTTSLRSSRRN